MDHAFDIPSRAEKCRIERSEEDECAVHGPVGSDPTCDYFDRCPHPSRSIVRSRGGVGCNACGEVFSEPDDN